jgi:DNA-binding response OmpR family regulator
MLAFVGWSHHMKPPSMPSASRRPVVLLVQQARDDAADMYADFLRYHKFAPITASDAKEARLLARQADIIVTGILLDGPADGIELIGRLRDDDATRHTPIIVLTACAWPRDRERAERAGCDVFLPKPCLPVDLLREVRLLLSAERHYGECTGVSAAARTSRGALASAVMCRPAMFRHGDSVGPKHFARDI